MGSNPCTVKLAPNGYLRVTVVHERHHKTGHISLVMKNLDLSIESPQYEKLQRPDSQKWSALRISFFINMY